MNHAEVYVIQLFLLQGSPKISSVFAGTLLCVLGFISAITVSVLDKVGMKQLGLDGVIQQESKKVVGGIQTAFSSRNLRAGMG